MRRLCNAQIEPARLLASIMEMAQFGGTEEGGVTRLALSMEDRQARDWLEHWCRAIGCQTSADSVGNFFARLPGRENLPAVLIGSHLDSQVNGGKYDGVYGIMAGLEAMHAIVEAGISPRRPIELVAWTAEEGSRFTPAMLGSAVFTGVISLSDALLRADATGDTLGKSLDRHHLSGIYEKKSYAAYLEAHIEQGPVLEQEGWQAGIVTGINGIRWYDVAVKGVSAHAGPFPMNRRRDAMMAAAKMIAALDDVARPMGDAARCTVGQLHIPAASRNVVPGKVVFSVDLRHQNEEALDHLEELVRQELSRLASALGVDVSVLPIWQSPTVAFDEYCLMTLEDSANSLGIRSRRIVSGAGHDAANLAPHIPTAMVFIPCRDGLSHNAAEHVEPEAAADGCRILLEAVWRMAND